MNADGHREYKDWAPTAFDPEGAYLPDQQNWLVAPVRRTRDSGPLTESNFESALESLGGESETVEVHRFGHWGPGWVEIILIDPDDEVKVNILYDIEGALANYPILDDMDFNEREMEAAMEIWQNCFDDWDRLRYMRESESQFDCDWIDLLRNARGTMFSGYPSELIAN